MTETVIENYLSRELANGALLILDATLTYILLRYIVEEIVLRAGSFREMLNIRARSMEAQMALAFCVYHFGTTIRDGYNWLSYRSISAGWDVADSWFQSQDTIVMALSIAMAGGLCVIRIFARRRWTWLIIGVLAALAPVIMHVIFSRGGQTTAHWSAAGDCSAQGIVEHLGILIRGCR